MKIARTRAFVLLWCLAAVGCRETPGEGAVETTPQVFPDLAPSAPATTVDLAGALTLAPGSLGQLASPELALAVTGGRCSLDSINEQDLSEAVITRGGITRFSGWVASSTAGPALSILLVGADNYVVAALPQAVRPDVATAIGLESGQVFDFQAQADLGSVAPGVYAVHLLQQEDSRTTQCALNRSVTVE